MRNVWGFIDRQLHGAVERRMQRASLLERYVSAVLISAFGILLQYALWEWIRPAPFLLLYGAVVVASWLGGLGPGIVATAICGGVANLLFMGSMGSFSGGVADIGRTVVFLVTGAVISTLNALLLDKSQELSAQRAVRESEKRLRALVDNLLLFVGVLDPQGRVIEANRAALEAAGIRSEDVVGRPFAETPWWTFSPDVQARLRDAIERAGRGEVVRFEVENRVAGGRMVTVDFTLGPIRDEQGRVIYLVPSGIDVTARKRYEGELRETLNRLEKALEVRDEFLTIASHELKTPVTSMGLQFQSMDRFLRKDGIGSLRQEQVETMLRVCNRQLINLTDLINNLLDVSGVVNRRILFESRAADLGEVARGAVKKMSEQLSMAKCETEVGQSGDLKGYWDSARLEQVVANLLSNAIKYAPGQPVKIAVEGKGEQVRLTVEDHGPGIAEQNRTRVFERFERLTLADKVSGMGIGLYLSREIIQAHGGRIWVESAPAGGARFIFTVPRRPSGAIPVI